MAAAAMMMMAAPTDGSPIIVFDDDNSECARPALLWIDPWWRFAIDPELLEECDDSDFDPAVAGSRRGLGAVGVGMGAALAGAFRMPATGSDAAREWWWAVPSIIIDEPSTSDTSPVRESSNVDVFELPGSDQIGELSPAESPLTDGSTAFLFTPNSETRTIADLPDLSIHVPSATNPIAVPEPSSLWLLGAGLALAARRRRKRR